MDAICQHGHHTSPLSEECNAKNVRWKRDVGVECEVMLVVTPPPTIMEGWAEGPWLEGVCIALEVDCISFLISFWVQLLVLCDCFLTFSLCTTH